jgi:hypothetical protein
METRDPVWRVDADRVRTDWETLATYNKAVHCWPWLLRRLVSNAMSEPDAGSAVADLTTRAEPDRKGGYRLYGRKVFNTGGMYAHLWVVWVRFGPERDACGAVLVEREAEGLTLRPHRFMSGETYSELSYLFSRTRGWLIAGGTVEMQKNAVAETVYGRRFRQRPPAGAHADPTPSKEADVHA